MPKLNPFMRRRQDRQPSAKGKLSEERKIYAEIEEMSDWLLRIREIRRAELLRLRSAINPALTYLLYHNGEFDHYYTSSSPLKPAAALLNEYLIFEADTSRKTLTTVFEQVPIADAPDLNLDIQVTVLVDIIDARTLIDMGVWNIADNVRNQIEPVVRMVSGTYSAKARSECESDMVSRIMTAPFDFGIKIVSATVVREVPAWLQQRQETLRKEADEERLRRMRREKEHQEWRDKVAREDEEYRRAQGRTTDEDRRKRERQAYFQTVMQEGGIAGLASLMMAEQDPGIRDEIRAFMEIVERQHDKNFDRRMEISQMRHDHDMERLELLERSDLLRPETLLEDPTSRQTVNDILRSSVSDLNVEQFDLPSPVGRQPGGVTNQLESSRMNQRQLSANSRSLDDDDDDSDTQADNAAHNNNNDPYIEGEYVDPRHQPPGKPDKAGDFDDD